MTEKKIIPKNHYECVVSTPTNIKKAAGWAWKCLSDLCLSFCGFYCSSQSNCQQDDYAKAAWPNDWASAQKEFHKAVSFLPSLSDLTDGCVACAVVDALILFPQIASRSEVAPVATLRLNGIDCYPDISFVGEIQKPSVPCFIVDTLMADHEHQIEKKCREMALLSLSDNELPTMPPWERECIESYFFPGQAIVKKIWDLKETESEEQAGPGPLFKQNLSTAVTACICLRDLLRIRYFFPNAINDYDFERLKKGLIEWIEYVFAYEKCLRKISDELYRRPVKGDPEAINSLSTLYSILLLNHPEMPGLDGDQEKIKTMMEVLIDKCTKDASDPVKEIAAFITNCLLRDCIYPTPADEPDYTNPKRYFRLLKEYWALCQNAILDRTQHHVAWQPYPLSTVFINIKSRLEACFKGLSSSNAFSMENISDKMLSLIDVLLYWGVDEFEIGSEELSGRVQEVAIWLEESELKLGTGLISLIREEETFIENARALIVQYDENAKTTFRGMMDKAETRDTGQNITIKDRKTFPTPKGAKWQDLHIRFMNNPTVYLKKQNSYVSTAIRAKIGNIERVISCEEMGMAKKNNKMPKQQWVLLYAFAQKNGMLDWDSDHLPGQVVKQKQALSRSLSDFFGIDGPPIEEWDKKGQYYRCRFKILPAESED